MKLPDEVTLIKNGKIIKENIPADVQPEVIFIDDYNIPLEEGDILQRTLPNGINENYKVLDRGYYSTSSGGEYQAKVKKITTLSNENGKPIYNIRGDNSRININSNDSSINITDKSSEDFFAALQATVKEEISGKDKEELLGKIEELKKAQDSNFFPKKYAEFMAIAADHATVLGPFFPALVQFLT